LSNNSGSQFERDTLVTRVSEGLWKADVSARWNVGDVPNGGYLMAIAGRVFSEAMPHPHPLTISGYYVEKSLNRQAELDFELIRVGKSVSSGQVRLLQEGRERARFTAFCGNLDTRQGDNWAGQSAPVFPQPQECVQAEKRVALTHRLDMRFVPEGAGWLEGKPGGEPEHRILTRFIDGSDPDLLSLLLFADAVPPTLFARFGPVGWIPTLELTVQLRAKPCPGYIKGRFATRYLTNGLLEEDGELWDAAGNLVALSRQLAMFRRPATR